nr:NADH dehydrogenase subunit 1 [Linognathus vituli]
MLIQFLMMNILVLIAVGYFSLFERKVLSIIQSRKGPNKVVTLGITQPLGDALKLVTKQVPIPHSSNKLIYSITPCILLANSLALWITPWNYQGVSLEVGVLLIITILSVTVYGPILSGWSSNSKFSLIGAMRAVAQALSFEIILSLSVITFSVMMTSFSVQEDGKSSILGLSSPIVLLIFILSLLAESGRSPYDLPEGESELVGGYSVDYGGSLYKVIFLVESLSTLFSGAILSIMCFPPFMWWKGVSAMLFIVLLRSALPRVRYDLIMFECWANFIPISIGMVMVAAISI